MNRTLLLLACGLFVAQAQEFRSTLTGRVTDPSGAFVAGAKVAAIKTDTNSRFETVSTSEGVYTIPMLPPGPYELRAEGAGFKQYVHSGIQIGSDTRIGQDIVLQLGSASEAITVTDQPAALETVSASAGQVITTREVESLPINGRAPMDLAVLGYGVVNTGLRDQNRPFENSGYSTFSMGGTYSGSNAALLDGVPNIGTVGTSGARVAFSPPVDAVQDVKVEAFNVDAAYGGFGGGTIEITTKSGTNQLHGSASEFNQVSALAATPFFTNAASKQKAPYRQNLWDLTSGGPVYIPKVLDGRNKMFFFFTYEGFRDSQPTPTYFTVPTDAERRGDFSGLLALNNKTKNYTLYDPNTGVLSGATVTRQPFPNNVIPKDRLNPIATKFLNDYVPMPNSPGVYDDTNNFYAPESTVNKYRAFSGRTDFNISNSNKLTVNARQSIWCQSGNDMIDNLAYLNHPACRDIWGGMFDDVHIFSPTLVGNLRVGFSRYDAYYRQASEGFDPTQLGFPSYIAANSTHLMMPTFTFSDGYAGNGGASYNRKPYNTYQLFNSFTKTIGTHAVKFGGQLLLQDYTTVDWSNSAGGYTFDAGSWVRANSTASTPTLGGSMAQFLLGLPTSGSLDISSPAKDDSWYEVLFVNDDWRARSNLMINAGLRWEYGSPTTEAHNRQIRGFDPAAVNSVTAAAQAAYANAPVGQVPAAAFKATGGLLFADPDHRGSYSTSQNFAPRLGVSWTPGALHNKTVIRTGAGFFYYNYGVQPSIQPGFTQSNAYVATRNSYLTPATTLSDPFPGNSIQRPVGAALGVNTYLGQSISFYSPELLGQYSLRWNLDVQQQLPGDMTLQVGYMGNHTVHLDTSTNLNGYSADYLSRLPYRDTATINALGAIVSNPMSGLLPGTGMNGSTTSVSALLRPFPQFSTITENMITNGSSYYHSLNAKLQKRFSHGLQLVANFNHSRLMSLDTYLNSGSWELQKQVSSADRPNSFVFSSTYDLPFGKGMAHLSHVNPVVNFVLGNWSAATVYSYHSGAPLSWGNVIYYGGPLNYDAHAVNGAFDTTRFNTVSSQQLGSNYRTFPQYFNNLRVDSANNVNFTLTKNFHIGERAKIQFRGESFNLFNHPLFGGPSLSATSSSFGRITSQTNTPRTIQFGVRLTY